MTRNARQFAQCVRQAKAPMASQQPEWAKTIPAPWLLEAATPAVALSQSLPPSARTDREVPADCRWHRLPELPPSDEEGSEGSAPAKAAVMTMQPSKQPARANEVSSRRAGRLARAKEAELAAERERLRREPRGADAVWAERKERILALLAEAEPNAGDMKRELRRLLSYADAMRAAAREERAEIAADLHQLVSPLVVEVQRLRGRLALAEGPRDGKDALAAGATPLVEEEAFTEDVLRAGRPGDEEGGAAVDGSAGLGGAGAPPPKAPPKGPPIKPVAKPPPVSARQAAVDAAGLAVGGAAALGRRERQAILRRVEAAVAGVARGGPVGELVGMLADRKSADGAAAAEIAAEGLDKLLLSRGVGGTPIKRLLRAADVEAVRHTYIHAYMHACTHMRLRRAADVEAVRDRMPRGPTLTHTHTLALALAPRPSPSPSPSPSPLALSLALARTLARTLAPRRPPNPQRDLNHTAEMCRAALLRGAPSTHAPAAASRSSRCSSG